MVEEVVVVEEATPGEEAKPADEAAGATPAEPSSEIADTAAPADAAPEDSAAPVEDTAVVEEVILEAVEGAPAADDTTTAPSSPDVNNNRRRRRHHRATGWEREHRKSISSDENRYKGHLERRKDDKGLLKNHLAIAVQEAKEREKRKHESPEYQAAQQQRRAARQARLAAEKERQVAREAEKEKERAAREAEKEGEKAAREAAAAKERQKLHSERRRRRTSFAESSNGSSTIPSPRPGFLRRMTAGESDCGGPLLKINMAKAVENATRPPPASRTSSDRQHRQHRNQGNGEPGEPRRRHRERPTSSRHESSKEGSSRVDDVPLAKAKNALANGLRIFFAL